MKPSGLHIINHYKILRFQNMDKSTYYKVHKNQYVLRLTLSLIVKCTYNLVSTYLHLTRNKCKKKFE